MNVQENTQPRQLSVLVVEDSENDYVLLVRELGRSKYSVSSKRVETQLDMIAALSAQRWDLVISDWSLPRFGAAEALETLKTSGQDLPFILVSGTIGEEVAVEALKSGADDFLLKGKLTRLVPAVERAVRDAAVRRERNEMQEQLLMAERMASVGILAAGAAHEINNPLAAMLANLELAGRAADRISATPEGRIIVAELADVREAVERIRNIVHDLRTFSRARDDDRGPVDLERVIESSLRMARGEMRHRATVVRDYGNVGAVSANESRLGQVFLNLLVNAAQAGQEGRDNVVRVSTRRLGDQKVVVVISDTGSGIAPDVLARLFTPFVTTKGPELGTGLGLSICRRIVTAFGGVISVESKVSVGTTFRVELLASAGEATPAPTGPRKPSVPPARRGRVLVVEDEQIVAAAVQRVLERDHSVSVASNARVALDMIRGGAEFDVILCDLMMPEMTGMDLYDELLASAPEQAKRMIFVTGGAFTARARRFLEEVPNARVEKPFDTAALCALVDERVT